MRLELSIWCHGLKDKDLLSQSDPVCILHVKNEKGNWVELGRTEVVKNNPDPVWKNTIQIDYDADSPPQLLKFEIFDWDTKSRNSYKQDFLGMREVALKQIVASEDMRFAAGFTEGPSTKTGELVVQAERISDSDRKVHVQFAARNLEKMDVQSHSDPFFVLSKVSGSGRHSNVARSEAITNAPDPVWKPMTLPLARLCNLDLKQTLMFDVFDEDRIGENDLIGSFSTCLEDLVKAADTKEAFDIVNPKKRHLTEYKNSGEFVVHFCKIEP